MTHKLNKIIIILFLFCLTQCYQDPFFELTIEVVDQNFNPIPDTSIIIDVTDVENGNPIDGSIIHFDSFTNEQGIATFSFENKAFVNALACFSSGNILLCGEGHIYLEANMNKSLTLMLENNECLACF